MVEVVRSVSDGVSDGRGSVEVGLVVMLEVVWSE